MSVSYNHDHDHAHDHARLQELADLRLGEHVDDPHLQQLVDDAAGALGLPVAAISIVLDAAQYFIVSHGLQDWLARVGGTPSEWSFCRHAVERRAPFIVPDATREPLTERNPLVRIDGIRSYLGIPLVTSKQLAVGALCVLATEPRDFAPTDVERLHELADEVLRILEARRQT